METVSVIIPTWNRSKELVKTVKSVLDQKIKPLEILVCDDGSSDNSEKIIKGIFGNKVIWIPGSHSGLPAVPRNRGLKAAKGEWIAFLDSDDTWEPGKLRKQLLRMEKFNKKAGCCNAVIIKRERKMGNMLNWNKDLVTFRDLVNAGNMVVNSSAIIHRSIKNSVGKIPEAPRLKAIEDYAYWLRVASKTDFVYLEDPLVNYNDDLPSSIRKTTNISYRQQLKLVLKDILEYQKYNNFLVATKLATLYLGGLTEKLT